MEEPLFHLLLAVSLREDMKENLPCLWFLTTNVNPKYSSLLFPFSDTFGFQIVVICFSKTKDCAYVSGGKTNDMRMQGYKPKLLFDSFQKHKK